MNNFPFIIALY